MSDPVTNVQIEDVLSSIRKLVSEEVRTQTRTPANSEQAAKLDTPKGDDRLILTPALRVDAQGPASGGKDSLTLVKDDANDADRAADPFAEEAGFIHAEAEPKKDADLLNLMDRVRAAGERTAKAQGNRPKGISAVSGSPSPEEDGLSPERAIESALAALGVEPFEHDQAEEPENSATSTEEKSDSLDLETEELPGEDLETAGSESDQFWPNEDQEGSAMIPMSADDEADWDLDDLSPMTDDAKIATPDLAPAKPGWLEDVDVQSKAGETPAVNDFDDLDISDPKNSDADHLETGLHDDENVGDGIVPTFLRHRGVSSLHQKVSEVEAVVSRSAGDWEPEADEDTDAAPGPQTGALPWDDEDHETTQENASAAVSADQVNSIENAPSAPPRNDLDAQGEEADCSADPVEDPDKAAMATADRIFPSSSAAHRQANDKPNIEDTVQTFTEADDSDVQPADGPTNEWEDVHQNDEMIPSDAQGTLASDDPVVIDEEILRDMVAEIVRQELQGALGERITRNVRKLVRREIHRALSAHDID